MIIRNELVEPETFYEVRRAAPQVCVFSVRAALRVIDALVQLSTPENERTGWDFEPYYEAPQKHLLPFLPEYTSSSQLGAILRALGLGSIRRGEGYCVFWNQAQLQILQRRFFSTID